MKVLFLYTELAGYFLKCCEQLAKKAEVHIVRWPVNKEAPFNFDFSGGVRVYDKDTFSHQQLHDLVTTINPSIIICSGWIDKDYLKIVRSFTKSIPTVLTCDTHWKGSPKQLLALFLSRLFLLPIFSHAWVPGHAQYKYVRKLGFKSDRIRLGFYCCDLEKFNSIYLKRSREQVEKKRFLYVGRYYEFKGLGDLWQAFIEAEGEERRGWELWCLGTGSMQPVEHPKIKHFGFVQPKDLEPLLAQCSVFVLPSRFEPWGVVVQEYAASGFPMLLSSEVGAGEAFLMENENGFSFGAGNIGEIKEALKKTMRLSAKDLTSMSEKSHQLAQANSPQVWAQTVMEMHHEGKKK